MNLDIRRKFLVEWSPAAVMAGRLNSAPHVDRSIVVAETFGEAEAKFTKETGAGSRHIYSIANLGKHTIE